MRCRRCAKCVYEELWDKAGRSIAEHKSPSTFGTLCFTLTYGSGDHLAALIFDPTHPQKWLKRIRKAGHVIRYSYAGEIGALGRAHWHVNVHFKSPLPRDLVRYPKYAMQFHWPHGHVEVHETTPDRLSYPFKYIQKGVLRQDGDMICHPRQLRQSILPPLGAEYFRGLAELHVDQGLAPQAPPRPKKQPGDPVSCYLEYTFDDVLIRRRHGGFEKRPLSLRDRSLELFLQHYMDTFRERKPGLLMPSSELLDAYEDGLVTLDPTVSNNHVPADYRKWDW